MTPAGFGKGTDAGFNTQLPSGLDLTRGKQFETYGGDGTFALVDPDDFKQALAATPNGGLVVTTPAASSRVPAATRTPRSARRT